MTNASLLDINAGLDHERAHDQLMQAAGRAFRHWMRLANNAPARADDVAEARTAYEHADADARRLRQQTP